MLFTRIQIVVAALAIVLIVGVALWFVQLGGLRGGSDAADPMPVVAIVPGATTAPTPDPSGTDAATALMPADLVSTGWLTQVAVATGIPARALQAYAGAAVVETIRNPGCHIGWNTLAAIGEQESAHGTIGGDSIDASGEVRSPIVGPPLDGTDGTDRVPDTDGGALDGDTSWDHAVGPMQILPSTWKEAGVDADGDGVADPDQIDDAVLTAADYLCGVDGDLGVADRWTAAIRAYNPDDAYVARVRSTADRYATEAASP